MQSRDNRLGFARRLVPILGLALAGTTVVFVAILATDLVRYVPRPVVRRPIVVAPWPSRRRT